MSNNTDSNNNPSDFHEVKSDFLISLIVTIAFAILPGVIQNLNLEPRLSITLMVILGIIAISIIYLVFKYPNSQIVKKITFNIKIKDSRAKSLFVFLITFVVMASSYIFWKNHLGTSI